MFAELDLVSLTLTDTIWISFVFLCLLFFLALHMFLKQYGNYRVAKTLTAEGEWSAAAHLYYFWILMVSICHLITVVALLISVSAVISDGMYGLIGNGGRAVFIVIGWSAYGFHFLARERAEHIRVAEEAHNNGNSSKSSTKAEEEGKES